ncbi:MAG: MBL fold metallo-hydrolase [Lachnospiraceae bacterium]|jgi:L-ascorbate metabolism protein UlaG (beta-lactamase superfamily)|nr:MBL fold metallo-hydrolase [Lachnospiraceae bacterium]
MGILIALLATFLLVFLFFTFYPSVGRYPTKEMRQEYAKRTPYYVDGKFRNMNEYNMTGGNRASEKGEHITPNGQIPVIKRDEIAPAPETELAITWLGHSSLLLQMGGMNILIDPVFSQVPSPVSFIGQKRFSEKPLAPEDLPDIDVALISHGHYDHLDYQSILQIDDKVKQYVVPLGTDSYLRGWGVDESKIANMAWWEDMQINGVRFAFVPAMHYAIRNPFRAGQTWWGGFVLNDGQHTVYFTGDSGYDEKIFSEVFERYGAIDLFLPDTGQYNTAWPQSHMNPAQAFAAAKTLEAKWVMPIHWGAFVLSNHNWNDPPQLITKQAENSPINIATPRIGETVLYGEIADYQKRWWEGID